MKRKQYLYFEFLPTGHLMPFPFRLSLFMSKELYDCETLEEKLALLDEWIFEKGFLESTDFIDTVRWQKILNESKRMLADTKLQLIFKN